MMKNGLHSLVLVFCSVRDEWSVRGLNISLIEKSPVALFSNARSLHTLDIFADAVDEGSA